MKKLELLILTFVFLLMAQVSAASPQHTPARWEYITTNAGCLYFIESNPESITHPTKDSLEFNTCIINPQNKKQMIFHVTVKLNEYNKKTYVKFNTKAFVDMDTYTIIKQNPVNMPWTEIKRYSIMNLAVKGLSS
jgi:hypothetical protein